MSCYAWEHGTIKLPSGVEPKLRKAVRELHNQRAAATLEAAKQFWRDNKTQNSDLYRARVDLYCGYDARVNPALKANVKGRAPSNIAADLHQLLENILFTTARENKNLRGAVARDLDRCSFGKRTNRDVTFPAGEGTITFNPQNKTVTWDVDEGNRSPERAREHPLGKLLFTELDRVAWTSRTGGEIIGNDEYNRDDKYEGGGSNYVVQTYSKQAAQEEARLRATAMRRPIGFYSGRW